MSQTLFLFPRLPDEGWLHQRHTDGVFRATARLVSGPYSGLALLKTGGVHAEETLAVTARDVPGLDGLDVGPASLVLDFPPLGIPIGPIPGPISAHLDPLRVILFVLATAQSGAQASVGRALSELGDPRAAYAHAYPPDGSFNLFLEFVGDDLEETLERVLTVVDRPEISGVRTLHTTASLTRGFGEQPAAPAS